MSDSFPKSIELKKRTLHERLIVAKVLIDSVLDEMPSVQPRKGKWIDGMCSECEESTQDFLTNFCPHCGCRMEEGDSDEKD